MKYLEFSAIYVGDLHGRIYAFEKAVEQFEQEKLDKLVFMGDYVDSIDYTSLEIKYLLKQVIQYKKENPEKVILLLGNHDWQYMYGEEYRCSGFRPEIELDLYQLFNDNEELFQVAWRNGDYMATHGGLLSDWIYRYANRLDYYSDKFGIDRVNNLDILLNAISKTTDRWILATIPTIRGGVPGSIGGPLWADISEIKEGASCIHKYVHIVGHSKVPTIGAYQHKGGPTTVFTDCLGKSDEFLILKK